MCLTFWLFHRVLSVSIVHNACEILPIKPAKKASHQLKSILTLSWNKRRVISTIQWGTCCVANPGHDIWYMSQDWATKINIDKFNLVCYITINRSNINVIHVNFQSILSLLAHWLAYIILLSAKIIRCTHSMPIWVTLWQLWRIYHGSHINVRDVNRGGRIGCCGVGFGRGWRVWSDRWLSRVLSIEAFFWSFLS